MDNKQNIFTFVQGEKKQQEILHYVFLLLCLFRKIEGNSFDATCYWVQSKFRAHDKAVKEKKQGIGFEGMWVNADNESLQAQWKSDFCMERYSFEKLVQILATVAAKKSTNFGKTITIQMPLDNFDRQMHSVQQLKHLLLESLHIF